MTNSPDIRPSETSSHSSVNWPYPVGTLGKKWTGADKFQWYTNVIQSGRKRSYEKEVVAKLRAQFTAKEDLHFELKQYGRHTKLAWEEDDYDHIPGEQQHPEGPWYSPVRYPLLAVKSRTHLKSRANIIITGGVHGGESSGVHGCLLLIENLLSDDNLRRYVTERFNVLIIPCVSPWGFEYAQRWTRGAVDPNRFWETSVYQDETITRLQEFVRDVFGDQKIALHADLHETQGLDRDEWSPAKAARDGDSEYIIENQPDGFYIVAGTPKDVFEEHEKLYARVVEEIAKVTPVVDKKRQVCNEFIEPNGVLYCEGGAGECTEDENVRLRQFRENVRKTEKLCIFAFGAEFAFITEICPSENENDPGFPSGHPENGKAQFAAVQAAFQFMGERHDRKQSEADQPSKRQKLA